MIRSLKISFFILVFSIMFYTCEEIVSYPDTPSIDYQAFTLYKTVDELGNNIFLGKLEFEFTDGDGNIGIYQPDSLNIADSLKYNLYLRLYERDSEGSRLVESFDSTQNFRIPYIEREGQNKTLKGTITVDLEYKTIEYDTIFYTFYITDRDFNKSNTDTTDLIIFKGLNLN